MELLELYVPQIEDLWFRQKMLSDPETMSYNANYDMDIEGYHKDTGCIDFPESEWEEWHEYWCKEQKNADPERFYAYVVRPSDGEFIGEVNYHYTPEKDWWDIGIVLYAPYRGMGYSANALWQLVAQALIRGSVTKLHNAFETDRIAARKCHLRAGFHDAGVENGIQHFILTEEDYPF